MTSPRVLLVAAFDSQLTWAAHVGRELTARGFACTYVAPRERSALSPRQREAAGVPEVIDVSRSRLLEVARQADVVVIALAGPEIAALCRDLQAAAGAEPGPVVVTGWVGVIIEKITAGYLDRSLADVVAVNAQHELEHFREVARQLDLDTDNLLLSGLPLLSTAPRPQRTGPVRHLVFADQPTVPATADERRYLYRRLLDYARRHRDRSVVLKPRHRPGEDTFHRMDHHPEDLLALDEKPDNFRFDYRPIPRLLAENDLLVTVSSTACLEAIDHGCRVALVLDLGIHERLGNQVFLESGLLRTFDQIEADDLGTPDPAWVGSWFGGRDAAPAALIADRVEKLLASGERPAKAMADAAYHRASAHRAEGPEPAPSALKRSQNRHGLVLGTTFQIARWWVPPVVQKTTRRLRATLDAELRDR